MEQKKMNTAAKSHDQLVKNLIPSVVMPLLQAQYPEKTFEHKTRIYLREYVPAHYQLSNPNSFICPDGGVVLADGVPVLICEAKKQGTNDCRLEAGLPRQSVGNAIERMHKNLNELREYMNRYDHFPYLVFCTGCDFQSGSQNVIDKLSTATHYSPFNQLHVIDKPRSTIVEKRTFFFAEQRVKRASVFVQVEPYEPQFIAKQCLAAVAQVLEHLGTEAEAH